MGNVAYWKSMRSKGLKVVNIKEGYRFLSLGLTGSYRYKGGNSLCLTTKTVESLSSYVQLCP